MKLELIIAYFLSVNISVLGMSNVSTNNNQNAATSSGNTEQIRYLKLGSVKSARSLLDYAAAAELEDKDLIFKKDYKRLSLRGIKKLFSKDQLDLIVKRNPDVRFACHTDLLECGDLESIKFLLEQGVNPNNTHISWLGGECWFSQYKIARLLLLYGLRLSPADDRYTQATYEKHIYPALTKPMKAAVFGDIESFNNLHNELSDRDSLYNRITGSYEHSQGRLNAALRYAAANCRVEMVKDLLGRGANPLAKCPDVSTDVASTEDLIIKLRYGGIGDTIGDTIGADFLDAREDSNTNIRNSYDVILELFKNSKLYTRRKTLGMYWQLRVLVDNGLSDIIPLMILHLDPEIAQQELEIAKQQVEDIESEFDRIHYNRAAAKRS